MVKCLPRDSMELRLLLELNHPEHRKDPWNPVPYVLAVVERDNKAFLVMERLTSYDDPPFTTVANYIDFFLQVLEVSDNVPLPGFVLILCEIRG